MDKTRRWLDIACRFVFCPALSGFHPLSLLSPGHCQLSPSPHLWLSEPGRATLWWVCSQLLLQSMVLGRMYGARSWRDHDASAESGLYALNRHGHKLELTTKFWKRLWAPKAVLSPEHLTWKGQTGQATSGESGGHLPG